MSSFPQNTLQSASQGGVHRTPSASYRMSSPYDRGDRGDRSNPASSMAGHENGGINAEFNNQFLPILPRSSQSAANRAGDMSPLHIAELHRLLAQHNLSGQRRFIDNLSTCSTEERLNYIMVHLLITDSKVAQVTETHAAIVSQLGRLEKICREAWQPNKVQCKVLRGLIRHYLIKPVGTYEEIADMVQAYLRDSDRAERARLDLYLTDMTVRQTTDDFIAEQAGQQKSSFRKEVINSVKNKVALEEAARSLVNHYHMRSSMPETVPDSIKATVALLRSVAVPFVGKKGNGADTGFWPAVEDKLEELYNENDEDGVENAREKGSKWLKWQQDIIAEDEAQYGAPSKRRRPGRRGRSGAISHATRAELDALVSEGIDDFVHDGDNDDEALQRQPTPQPEAGSSTGFMFGGVWLPRAPTEEELRDALSEMRYAGTPQPE